MLFEFLYLTAGARARVADEAVCRRSELEPSFAALRK
jgi:hypothetical protein